MSVEILMTLTELIGQWRRRVMIVRKYGIYIKWSENMACKVYVYISIYLLSTFKKRIEIIRKNCTYYLDGTFIVHYFKLHYLMHASKLNKQ